MTLAEEFKASPADREAARKGFSIWNNPNHGMVLVEAWALKQDGSQRLQFPDESVLIIHPDGSETAGELDA